MIWWTRKNRTMFDASKIFVLLIIIMISIASMLFVASCARVLSYKNDVVSTKFTTYQAVQPAGEWKKISAKDTDLAFWNDKIAAFIMVNSTCDEYRDAPVQALANHLFVGIENRKIIVQKEVMLDGRKAVYTVLEGWLDGGFVKVAAYTLVKNYCTYDISYSAPISVFDKGEKAFNTLVGRFKVISRKRK